MSLGGTCELDVAPAEFHILAGDVIAQMTFEISYKEGKKIFELKKDQAVLVHEAFYSIYFPGFRFNSSVFSGMFFIAFYLKQSYSYHPSLLS